MIVEQEDNLKTVQDEVVEGDETNSSKSPGNQSRYYRQRYRKAWEEMPEFNGCLEEVPGNASRAYCKVCKRNIHAHRLTLLKHTVSIRHMKLAQEQYKKKLQLEESSAQNKLANKPNAADTATNANSSEVDSNSTTEIGTVNNEVSDAPLVLVDNEPILLVSEDDDGVIADKGKTPEPPAEIRSPITTHVLDTSKGLPVPSLPVSIYQLVEGRWTYLNEAHTNPDGRCTNLLAKDSLKPGRYKLHFDTDKYFELRNNDRLFPFIEIAFDVRSPTDHLHIPLLVSPYGYTTYRGS